MALARLPTVSANASHALLVACGGEVVALPFPNLAHAKPTRGDPACVACFRECRLCVCADRVVSWSKTYKACLRFGDVRSFCLGHTSSIVTSVAVNCAHDRVATCDRNEKVRVSRWPQCSVVEALSTQPRLKGFCVDSQRVGAFGEAVSLSLRGRETHHRETRT